MASVGVTLGNYEIDTLLGSTGIASTYVARNSSGTPVVLKTLRSYFAQEEELFRRFIGEMDTVRQHPSPRLLMPIEEQFSDQCWLVREYSPGSSLHATWTPTAEIADVLPILQAVAEAQEHLLSIGLPHRNMKPANVFWDKATGNIQLADVGMVTLAMGTHMLMRITSSTPMPSFLAPEYIESGEADSGSEAFSLAVLAYWLLCGEVPYQAEAPSTMYAKAMRGNFVLPTVLNPNLPPTIDRAMKRALAPFAAARPASPTALVDELREALGTDFVPTTAGRVWTPAPEVVHAVITPAKEEHDAMEAAAMKHLWEPPVPENMLKKRAVMGSIAATVVAISAIAYAAFTYTPEIPLPTTTVSAAVAPNQWALPRHNVQNTGHAPVNSSQIKGNVLWSMQTNQPFEGSPTVADGTLYVGTGDKRVMAIDAMTGATKWQVSVTGPVDSAPVIAGDLVYVGLRDARLLAYNRNTGKIEWEFAASNPVYAPGVVSDGQLFQGSSDSYLYGLDAVTGAKRWQFAGDGWIVASASVQGDLVVLVDREGWAHMLDRLTGKQVFRFFTGGSLSKPPAIVGDRAYIMNDGGLLFSVDLTQRSTFMDWEKFNIDIRLYLWGLLAEQPEQKGRVWVNRVRSNQTSQLAVANGRIFVGTDRSQLIAYKAETGEVLWTYNAGTPLLGAPTVTNDTLYIGGFDGKLFAIDPETGKLLWTFETKGKIVSSPAIANGVLYLTSQDGTLYALH